MSGARRSGKLRSRDIPSEVGEAVYPIKAGKVIHIDSGDGYGKIEIEKSIDIVEEKQGTQSSTIPLVLCRDIIMKIVGKHTGQLYVFNGAGSVLEVDELDAQEMLQKGITPSCCGSYSTPYFQIVER